MDFGKGAWVLVEGKRKRPHLFRIVLSHSRKAYNKGVWRQTSENFIRCLENAFRHFGGVPQTVVTDNLKAAVIKALNLTRFGGQPKRAVRGFTVSSVGFQSPQEFGHPARIGVALGCSRSPHRRRNRSPLAARGAADLFLGEGHALAL